MENEQYENLNRVDEIKKTIDDMASKLGLDESGKLGLTFFITFAGKNGLDSIKKITNAAYNQALEDVLNCVEWDGYTLDIKERIESLKSKQSEEI